MAPTICDDDLMEPFGRRALRHRSVISYVGRQTNRAAISRNEFDPTEKECRFHRNSELNRHSLEYCSVTKRHRQEPEFSSESDDSTDSIANPMTFHNYAKRFKYSGSEDDSDKCMSASSDDSNDSASSTLSISANRENMQLCRHLLHPTSLIPAAPVSSTTGAMSVYRRFSRVPLRSLNPYYQKDLIEIAMKTIILLQKNRSLHARLHQLKLETRAFVNSVMSNPENAKLRETISPADVKSLSDTTKKCSLGQKK